MKGNYFTRVRMERRTVYCDTEERNLPPPFERDEIAPENFEHTWTEYNHMYHELLYHVVCTCGAKRSSH